MKLQISTAAIAALSSTPLFSISDNVLLAHATESPLSPRAIYAANIHEYEEYLKKKLRAKIVALRKKSRGEDTSSKEEVCSPIVLRLSKYHSDETTADLGVLSSSCMSHTQTCVPDPLSSLGGRCLSAGGMSQEDDLYKSTNSTRSMNHAVGAECIPQDLIGDEYDLVDIGILNGCSNPEYVCLEDASSPAGGICVDSNALGTKLDTTQNMRGHRRLLECDYKNGTSGGTKCTGNLACNGLTPTFIATQIGCGSCNGDYGEPQFCIQDKR